MAEEKKKEKESTAKEDSKESKSEVKLNAAQKKVLEAVSKMTILELADLVKAMEEEFGISAAMPVAAAAAPAAGGGEQEEEEEKTSFTIVLKEAGSNKIGAIKAVKEITQLGLKEAKDLVESAPKPVVENVSKEQGDEAKAKLEEAGCKVEVQ